jgi:hypothetical protein
MKRAKEVKVVNAESTLCEYGTLKPVQVILRRGRKRGRSRRDETNWDTLYVYMEMSQRNPMYNYYILIKLLK